MLMFGISAPAFSEILRVSAATDCMHPDEPITIFVGLISNREYCRSVYQSPFDSIYFDLV